MSQTSPYEENAMSRAGTKDPWFFSSGFNMMVDFCVWVLETDERGGRTRAILQLICPVRASPFVSGK